MTTAKTDSPADEGTTAPASKRTRKRPATGQGQARETDTGQALKLIQGLADAITGGAGSAPSSDEGQALEEKRSQATRLVDLAHELYDLGVTEAGQAFAVPKTGPRVVRPLRYGRPSLMGDLGVELHRRSGGKVVATSNARKDALEHLAAEAEAQPKQTLAARVARPADDTLVLDLGDETGRAVVITPHGWEVVDQSPVLFQRTPQTLPLPIPESDGASLDPLWPLVNIAPDSRELYGAAVVSYLFPRMDHPILDLSGEAGAGKTTTAQNTARLVDPSAAPLARMPSREQDLDVVASQSYVLAFDNLSRIEEWQSDALCSFVTGVSSVRRELYSDAGLSLLKVRLCAILTSINAGTPKPDLAQRLLPVRMSVVSDAARRDEEKIDRAFAVAHPKALGALLDLAVMVLRELPAVDEAVERGEVRLPRLAGFGRLCSALDRALGTDRLGAYRELLTEQAADAATEDEVASAVREFVQALAAGSRQDTGWDPAAGCWRGTPTELHAALSGASLRSPLWPKTAPAFGKRVSVMVGPLRSMGVEVGEDRAKTRHRTKSYVLSLVSPTPAAEPTPAPEPETQAPAPDPEPSPAAEDGPCATCAAPGPSCGLGGIAEDEAPCVMCGEPTRVRARCGVARHGNCRPGGGSTPDGPPSPAPSPRAASPEAAQGHSAPAERPSPTPGRPHGGTGRPRPTGGAQPASRPRATTRPRRGQHLYGVLDGDGLTVVTDRAPGPAEPLGDDYPAGRLEAVELARRLDLEALWLHETALPLLGEPIDPPDGENGWEVYARDEPGEVELCVPGWLRSTTVWGDAGTGRELAAALGHYEAALNLRFRTGPPAMALSVLGLVHKRHGSTPLVAPAALPPLDVIARESDLIWARPLTEQEAGRRWVIGLDKHGAYPGTMRDLTLGRGDPEHHPAGRWEPKLPGRHRITDVTPAPGRDPLLPDVLVGVARGGEWRCTEALRYAAEAGVGFRVVESWVWPEGGKPLAPFGKRVREGRAALSSLAGTDPAARLALTVLKQTYAAIGGALASRTTGARDNPGVMWRPDWRATLIAKSRVNVLRNADKLTARPFAANVDELLFATDDPDPAALGLPLGDEFGQWGVHTGPVALPELADVITDSGARGRPHPLLRAIRKRAGDS